MIVRLSTDLWKYSIPNDNLVATEVECPVGKNVYVHDRPRCRDTTALLYVKTAGKPLRPGIRVLRFTDGIVYRYDRYVYAFIGGAY